MTLESDKLYEVIIWSDHDIDKDHFETFKQAKAGYDQIILSGFDTGKQLTLKSLDVDGEVKVLHEEWRSENE
jgi:hypothetical protein